MMVLYFGETDTIADRQYCDVGNFVYGNQTIIPDINGDGCDEFIYGNSSANCILYYGEDTITLILCCRFNYFTRRVKPDVCLSPPLFHKGVGGLRITTDIINIYIKLNILY